MNNIIKPKRSSNFAMISIHNDSKSMLDEMRKSGLLSYSDVIFYLLVKAGHLIVDNQERIKYEAIDEFINGSA
jgi:hypothetical protein